MAKKIDIFEGDGRKDVQLSDYWMDCYRDLLNCEPTKNINRGVAKRLIENFEEHGMSVHSADGHTLWVILEYLRINDLKYKLTVDPGYGFTVEKM